MDNDQLKMFILTILIDIGLIYLLLYQKLNITDYIFCYIILISHLLFLYGLWNNNEKLLDFLHYLIFIFLSLTIFVENIYLLTISLFLISIIQILWIIEERCILNKKGEINNFGYGKEINICSLILTIILSIKIGYKYNK